MNGPVWTDAVNAESIAAVTAEQTAVSVTTFTEAESTPVNPKPFRYNTDARSVPARFSLST